jgi:hypothetical protein
MTKYRSVFFAALILTQGFFLGFMAGRSYGIAELRQHLEQKLP